MSSVLTPVEAYNPDPAYATEPAGWEQAFLSKLGVPNPTAADIKYVDTWFGVEHGSSNETGGGKYGGENNLFDTSLPTVYSISQLNSAGVQNYADAVGGEEANAETLLDSDPSYGYSEIVTGLKQGASVSQLEAAENASKWGTTFSTGSSPAPSSGTGSSDPSSALSASSGSAGGIADSLASGILGSLRDLAEIAGGLALIALGVVLILRDLEGAGVPLPGVLGVLAHPKRPALPAGTPTEASEAKRHAVARDRALNSYEQRRAWIEDQHRRSAERREPQPGDDGYEEPF